MTQDIRGRTVHVVAGSNGLGRMNPGTWLNDELINYHVELLADESGEDIIFLSCFFFTRHLRSAPELTNAAQIPGFDPLKVRSFDILYLSKG